MRFKSVLLTAAALVAVSGIALAATQGTPGATSTGTVQIQAGKNAAVRISGLDDISFAASATTPAAASDPVCIFSNPGSYLIRATSGNASGTTFRLKDSGTNYIAYGVRWYNAATGGTGADLQSGTDSASITGANQTSVSCGGSNTARIEVTLDDASFVGAPAGTYNDTLTLLVTPP